MHERLGDGRIAAREHRAGEKRHESAPRHLPYDDIRDECGAEHRRGVAHAAQQRLYADPNSDGGKEVVDNHFNASKEVEA